MKNKKWRALAISLVLVMALAFVLPACSGSEEKPTTTPPKAQPTQAQPTQAQATQAQPSQAKPTQAQVQPTQAQKTSSAGEPQRGGTLRQLTTGSLSNLGYSPTMPGHMASFVFGCLEGFVQHNGRNGTFNPQLFTEWEEDPNEKYIIFKLRKGVKYHDGTDFNAEGVKWYLDLKQKESPGWLANVTSTEVIDDYTIKLNTTHFDIVMWAQLNEQHASPTQLAKGVDACMFYPVGTGPLKFVEYKRDQVLKYERFDDYWGGQPYLDGMECIFMPDSTAQLAALLAGEGDHIRAIQYKDIDLLKKNGFELFDIPMVMCGIIPDQVNPDSLFLDKRVREAIDYAIDRETISQELGYGYMQPLKTIYPTPMPGYVDGIGREYNPDKAKQLLAEAGFPNGLETDFHVSQFANMDVMVAVQQYLAEVGINAHIKEVDMGTWTALRRQGWEGLLYMHGIFQAPYEYNLNRAFGSAYADYINAVRPDGFDDLLQQTVKTVDIEARKPMAEQMQRMATDNAMYIPLVTYSQIDAVTPRLHDHGMYEVHGTLCWFPDKAWFSEK
ncbi:MAG: hypothetical protein JXA46_19830 [Dehalococcoidales bacterium]|nr:hypothetical protein [Dehalococcoidales bacterium]